MQLCTFGPASLMQKKKKKKQFGAKMGSLKCFIVNLKKNVWKDVSIIALP